MPRTALSYSIELGTSELNLEAWKAGKFESLESRKAFSRGPVAKLEPRSLHTAEHGGCGI